MLDDIPLMMIVSELDAMSLPEDKLALFERLRCPKRRHLVKGKGHIDVLVGEGSKDTMNAMLEFYESELDGAIEKED